MKKRKMQNTISTRGYLRGEAAHRNLKETMKMCCDLLNASRECHINAYKWALRLNPHLSRLAEVERIEVHRRMRLPSGKYGQSPFLTSLRKHNPKWKALDRRVARGILEQRHNAFQAFYSRVKRGEKKAGFPRYKHRIRTLHMVDARGGNFKYDPDTGKGRVKIQGLPTIRFKRSGIPDGQVPNTIRITYKPTGIWLSFVFNLGGVPKIDDSIVPHNPVGIDVGITERAVTSSGDKLCKSEREEKRREEKRRERKRLQRKMHRQREAAKREGRAKSGFRGRTEWVGGRQSRGYRNARKQLARINYREQVRDRNDLHRWTTGIVRAHDGIVVEDLEIKNMMKSAKGTPEEPGKNVAQKRGLNRSIGEQSWSTIYLQLEYKAERAGIPFKKVDPKHTSQTCSACGSVDAASRKRKKFHCVSCGYDADADYNAAVNIRSRGFPDAAGLLPRGRQPTQPECVVVPETYHHTLGEQIPLWNFHGG